MAKQRQRQEKPHVVVFVEGDTDVVFFRALLDYYCSASSAPIASFEVHNLKGVSKYNAKFEGKLKNDIIPKSQKSGKYIKAVCCSYDTDVFEYNERPVVNWALIRKIVKRLGIEGFCEVRVHSMIEDWLMDDLEGLCRYLGLTTIPKNLSGTNAFEKLQKLFRLKGVLYHKGFGNAQFVSSLDFAVIRNKRKDALFDLEKALGVEIS